jgi:two-component system, chemotaxis family, protein-glutamate methylesterase/glutaminase
MPRMDGLTFLKRVMIHHPIPTIIVSSLGQASCAATLEALRCGAVDVLAKPDGPYSVGDLRRSLAAKIRGAAGARPQVSIEIPSRSTQTMKALTTGRTSQNPKTVIAIGASTGGTVAIQELLVQLPADMPGIVITQHIPAGFSLAFANRLNRLCSMEVKEAVNGDELRPGVALVAPGDFHILLRHTNLGYEVELQHGPHVCYQRPSVDVMFMSVAQTAGSDSIGILLTGMGSDGAKGMLALRRAGAFTIAQSETSCVVYGMPREANRLNAVCTDAPLADIPELLMNTVRQHSNGTTAIV